MGIYIPNMEKPKTCFSCSFNDGLFCSLIDDDSDALLSDNPVEEISTRRLDACPLIDIVRCGECKYYIDNTCDCYSLYGDLSGDLIGVHFEPNEDHFCSYGERRSE